MAGRRFIYIPVVGVAPEFQGKGFGGRLLRAIIADSERESVPLYLETETESNVRLYEKFGFAVIKRITLPGIDLPTWEMVREIPQ